MGFIYLLLRIFLQIELHRELAVIVYLYLGINLIIILESLKAEDQIGGKFLNSQDFLGLNFFIAFLTIIFILSVKHLSFY